MTVADGLLNVQQAAAWLGIPAKSLYRLTAAREIEFNRLPGTKHIRFSLDQLKAYANAGRQAVITAPALRLLGTHPPSGPDTPPPPSGPKVPTKSSSLRRVG